MFKTARKIGVEDISDKNFATKYADRVRHGKTQKDHKSGAHAARFANRDARVEWQQDNRSTNDTFPGKN
jgi:hypothetical protein